MPSLPQTPLFLLAALLLVLFFALGKKGGTSSSVTPSGSIGEVTVSAPMRSHLAPKAPNQELSINVVWTPATRNSSGSFIPWNYQLGYSIRTTAGVLVRSGILATHTSIGGNGNPANLQRFVPGVAGAGNYDFSVDLLAMISDGNGQPVLPYILLDAMTHPSAFRIG